MSRKSAAVLDVRSSDVTVVIGQRGVNNTFVIQGMHTQPYKGYADGEFFDTKDLQEVVFTALDEASAEAGVRVRELYVGVPAEFLFVRTQRCFTRFENKRKVVRADVQALAESEPQEDFGGAAVIRKQAAYYVLSDRRRAFDPVGMVSNSLEAQFCYFLADDRFIDCMDNFLAEYGVRRREYLPAAQAQAVYLLPRSARAAGAILWDVDKISMSFDVVEGECVVWQQACSAGGGHVTAQIYFEEKAAAGVPFYVLEALIGKINLASMDEAGATVEYADRQATYTVSVSFLKGCVQDGLDLLCDIFGQCFEMSGDPGLYYRPIYLTGGGITEIRGVREYLSMRLGRPVEILAPQVPSYDRAAQSSVLSLLNMALERQREKSFLYKLFHGIGG